MKILCVIDSLGSGGAQRQIVTLAKLLKDKGFQVSILCYSHDDFFANCLDEAEIPIYWEVEPNYIKRILRVRRFIRRGNYDAVISFLVVPNFLNCIAAIGGKRWRVLTSERSSKKESLTSFKGKIFAWFQRYSDAIVCNSNNAKEMWIEHYPRYKNKLEVIYNPVILPSITSEYIPKRNGKLHIVVAASYQYLKNPIGVVKALMLMNAYEKSKIKINWYGRKDITNGDTRAYDEAVYLIKRNNLEDVITLNEPIRDIANKMYEADFVGLFSELEGLPNAICEGMMLGKPLIMTKVSDYTKLVDDNNGVLCEWDNPQSIKNAFFAGINLSDEELLQMGMNSKEKANQMFSKDTIIEQWIDIIRG